MAWHLSQAGVLDVCTCSSSWCAPAVTSGGCSASNNCTPQALRKTMRSLTQPARLNQLDCLPVRQGCRCYCCCCGENHAIVAAATAASTAVDIAAAALAATTPHQYAVSAQTANATATAAGVSTLRQLLLLLLLYVAALRSCRFVPADWMAGMPYCGSCWLGERCCCCCCCALLWVHSCCFVPAEC